MNPADVMPLDDCLAQFDEAFSRIDARMAGRAARPHAARVAPPSSAIVPAIPSPAQPFSEERLWEVTGSPLQRLLGTLANLSMLQGALEHTADGFVHSIHRDVFARVFAEARDVCFDLRLFTACLRADFAAEALNKSRLERLKVEIAELVRHIQHDVRTAGIALNTPIRSRRIA